MNFADLSGYNENVDLRAYAKAGYRVIVLKATEGVGFKSDSFPDRWKLAGSLGLTRVAYHFARPSKNVPEAEARNFLAWVNQAGRKSTDILCLDWEDPDFKRNGDGWVERFRVASGCRLLYSYGSYLVGTLSSTHGMPYWHAAYIDHPESTIPGFAKPKLVAIQFTNGSDGASPHYLAGCGTLSGQRRCDVNRLTVSLDVFKALAGVPPVPQPPEGSVSSAPHRDLRITDPLTRGDDVEALQKAIGRQIDRMGLGDFGVEKPTADKVFGHGTLVAARAVGRELGAPDLQLAGPVRVHLQQIVRAPWRRTPAELARGVRRMAQRKRRRKDGRSRSVLPGPPGWGGSRAVIEETLPVAAQFGAPLTSTKRYRVIAGSSSSSDHDWRNLRAYAHDYGTFSGAGLARAIGRHFGCPFDPVGTYSRFNVSRDGRTYSVQILWAVTGHFNHVHVGCHRV